MTPQDILAVIAPDLANSNLVDGYVALATQQTSQKFYGVNYTLAIALKAAHEYELNTVRKGQAGVLTYEGEGRRMRAYGGTGVIKDAWRLTAFGMQLEELRKSSGMGATSTAENIIAQLVP